MTSFMLLVSSIRVGLAYRASFLLRALSVLLFAIVAYALWTALYADRTLVDGIGLAQMLTYAVVGQVLHAFTSMELVFRIEERIRTGDIVLDLVRPMDLQLREFWVELGRGALDLGLRLVVVVPFAWLVLDDSVVPASPIQWLWLLVAVAVAFCIVFGVSYCIAGLAWWLLEIEPLDHLSSVLQLVLSGSIVPLWFFPEWIASWAGYLPFVFFYQVPMSVFINELSGTEVVTTLAVGIVWAVVLLVLGRAIWRRGVERGVVFGG